MGLEEQTSEAIASGVPLVRKSKERYGSTNVYRCYCEKVRKDKDANAFITVSVTRTIILISSERGTSGCSLYRIVRNDRE